MSTDTIIVGVYQKQEQRQWTSPIADVDETFSDAYGNTVAVLNKGGSPRIMLAAHADEIGMTVNFIDDRGYIYVRKLGGNEIQIVWRTPSRLGACEHEQQLAGRGVLVEQRIGRR